MYSCWFFFFFKQKTAYEMRISDWSSDVCSSDLLGGPGGRGDVAAEIGCAPVADAQHLARTRERHARERFGHWFGKTCSDAGLGQTVGDIEDIARARARQRRQTGRAHV